MVQVEAGVVEEEARMRCFSVSKDNEYRFLPYIITSWQQCIGLSFVVLRFGENGAALAALACTTNGGD